MYYVFVYMCIISILDIIFCVLIVSCVSMFAYIIVNCGFHVILYVSCFMLSCFFQLYMLFSLK